VTWLDQVSVNLDPDKWYEFEVEWRDDNVIAGRLIRNNTVQGEVCAFDDTFESGGIGMMSNNRDGEPSTTVFDHWRII